MDNGLAGIVATVLTGGVPLILGIAVVVLWRKNEALGAQITDMYQSKILMEAQILSQGTKIDILTGKVEAYAVVYQAQAAGRYRQLPPGTES